MYFVYELRYIPSFGHLYILIKLYIPSLDFSFAFDLDKLFISFIFTETL